MVLVEVLVHVLSLGPCPGEKGGGLHLQCLHHCPEKCVCVGGQIIYLLLWFRRPCIHMNASTQGCPGECCSMVQIDMVLTWPFKTPSALDRGKQGHSDRSVAMQPYT